MIRPSLIALAVCCLSAANPSYGQEPQPAEIDVRSYLGDWFELARTPNSFQDNRPRRDGERLSACFNTTTTYTALPFGLVGVENFCTRSVESTGEPVEESIEGIAWQLRGNGNRDLQVAFGPPLVRLLQRLIFFAIGAPNNYQIAAVGPLNEEGLYSWAVVTSPGQTTNFLLTREAKVDDPTLDTILAAASAAGLPVDELQFLQ